MSSATQCLRGIDTLIALLCITNLALLVDSLSHPHLATPAASSANATCLFYCLFNVITLLVILFLRTLPLLFRVAGYDAAAAACCGFQLAIQLFLLLPRTLVMLALLSAVLRSRVPLLGDSAHSIVYLSSALLLFVYSCALLVLDCQNVQRWAVTLPAPRSAAPGDEVRILGLSMFSGPPWMMEHSTSSRHRGLSEHEIERVTTLTTFRAPARAADKPAQDALEEKRSVENVQPETTIAVTHPDEQKLLVTATAEAHDEQQLPIPAPPHHNNPFPAAPSPSPPEFAPQTVSSTTGSSAVDSVASPAHLRCALCCL